MVIVRIWGGLGNQLFQYAAGFAVASKLKTTLLLDTWRNDLDPNRPNELHHFNVTARPWNKKERTFWEKIIRIVRPSDGQTGRWARFLKKSIQPFVNGRFNYVEDLYCGYQPQIFSHQNHVYLAGTWASEKYFEEVSAPVRAQYALKRPPDDENLRMLDKMSSSESICLHVRRGDYVSVPETRERHGLCSLDYYNRSLEYLSQRLKDPTVYVFSDDPGWVKDNLRPVQRTCYVTHNFGRQNHLDLPLMSACQHFIIANSTFSWWGAWLSDRPGKIVIAPRQWTADSSRLDDPIPERWIRL